MTGGKTIRELIEEFGADLTSSHDERISNEYNVQFYLGYCLYKNSYEIKLEKDARGSGEAIDLIVVNNEGEQSGIEIKCPLGQGGQPQYMASVLADINYLEKLKYEDKKIKKGFFFMLTNNKAYWTGKGDEGNQNLYRCFCNNKDDEIIIPRKIEWKNGSIVLSNQYRSKWISGGNNFRYFLIEV